MSSRVLRHLSAFAIAAAVAGLMATSVAGQSSLPPKPSAVPRTPDGKPDLQGNWTNNSVTPLERPEAWADKTTSERRRAGAAEEARRRGHRRGRRRRSSATSIVENALAGIKNPDSSDSGTGNYNHFWLVERDVEDRRTSLITDPPDGRLPALTTAASDRQAAAAPGAPRAPLDNPEERGVGERCVNFGVPKLGAGYNSYYQIVQTPTHVVFMSEMAHDARIIPLDGRPHPGQEDPDTGTATRAAAGKATRWSSSRRTSRRRASSAARARTCTWSSASRALARTRSTTRSPSPIRRCGPSRGRR